MLVHRFFQAEEKSNRTESMTSIGSGGKKSDEAATTEGEIIFEIQDIGFIDINRNDLNISLPSHHKDYL